jgi:hypothetical protein
MSPKLVTSTEVIAGKDMDECARVDTSGGVEPREGGDTELEAMFDFLDIPSISVCRATIQAVLAADPGARDRLVERVPQNFRLPNDPSAPGPCARGRQHQHGQCLRHASGLQHLTCSP